MLKYREFWLEKHNEIGLTTGLAWTEVGGTVLTTEATLMEGKGRLTLTGKLGDVMQESAQAAMSYIRSRSATSSACPRISIATSIFTCTFPKAPSPRTVPPPASPFATSIVSALTRIPVRCDVTMTGEITLRGKVLPIGGVKEKLLAAHRMGLRTVLLPKDNEKDLAEIPQEILSSLTIRFVETMDEVLQIALERLIVPIEHAAVAPVAEPFVGRYRERQEFDQLRASLQACGSFRLRCHHGGRQFSGRFRLKIVWFASLADFHALPVLRATS